MKYTFLIPVHIARDSADGWKEGDVIYDHPTPLDQPGFLGRTLESLKVLADQEFNVVLILSSVTPEIDLAAQAWVKNVIAQAPYRPRELYLFCNDQLEIIKNQLNDRAERFNKILSLGGYPQERNCGLIAGYLLNSQAVIWLDDDELVKDPDFLKKIDEGLSQTISGERVKLLTGACPEGEEGSCMRTREMKPWMTYWNKIKVQNETFQKIFCDNPRWKKTPLSHGGLSIIHREVFSRVPYDLYALRGEDMDYNLNTRMFGFTFFADNTLEIRHLPPKRLHPIWQSFRQDMLRFLWERLKIKLQVDKPDMKKITAEEFDPYPGYFLKDNLEEMIFKSQSMLAAEYLTQGKPKDAAEALNNIFLSKNSPILDIDAFKDFTDFQKLWIELISQLEEMPNKKIILKI